MSRIDKLYLMIRMLKENYETALTNLQKQRAGISNRSLSSDERQACEEAARKAVCEIGISMYDFRNRLSRRYDKSVEYPTIRQTVDIGIEQGYLAWTDPRRYDQEKGFTNRHIVLTEKGFDSIRQPFFIAALTMVHSVYISKPRRRR